MSVLKNHNEGRVLAIDYGSVRTGIAMSDPLRIIAQGFGTIHNSPNAIETIIFIVQEKEVSLIVVGLPLTLKGEKGMKSDEVDIFIKQLRAKTSVEVVQWDERFTSRMAQQSILAMGTKKKKRQTNKGKIDEVAATILLQSFLDQTVR